MATPEEIRERWSGASGPPDWETVLADGLALRHESGIAGDHRFSYGPDSFHISADAGTVLCSVERPDDPRGQRQLLDTILFSVSFANGYELLHASAVEIDDAVVAFIAPTGGGKSSIAAELRRRGHRIFCDDVLAIGRSTQEPICHPGPAVMSIPSAGSLVTSLGASVIARFENEDEVWVELKDAAVTPRALRSVYLVDRHADSCFASRVATATVLDLLPHAISLVHDAARARQRFDLFSALVDGIEIFRLGADRTASPSAVADLVQSSLEDLDHSLVAR